MTNLKKVLSLALVFALAFGLMISAAAVDLTDWDDIENQDAVELLAALDIMAGHADGTFDPQGFLTRAQVAKMAYVSRRGVDDYANLFKGTSNSQFKDVPSGSWYEGYVNWAAAMGIVAGDGKGNFKPDDPITGFEILKIALVALGYKAELEGFVGSMWQANVAARAMDAGLTEGYEGNPAAPITRDEAAGIFSNLIYAQVVKYDDSIVTPIYTATNDPLLFGERYLNLNEVSGVVTANEYATLADTAPGSAAIRPGYTMIGNAVYPVSTPASMLGKKVTILVKGTPADTTKAKIYGEPIVSASNTVFTYTNAALQSVVKDAITSAGLNAASLNSAATYVNAVATTPIASGAATVSSAGQTITIIDNDDDADIEFVLIDEYDFGRVTAYKAMTSTANGELTISGVTKGYVPYKTGATTPGAVPAVGFDDVKLYDFVNYRTFGGKLYVQKADSVAGQITAKTTFYGSVTSISVAGVAYTVSGSANNAGITDADQAVVRAEYTVYLDILGNAVAVNPISVKQNYAYVHKFQVIAGSLGVGGTPKAYLVLDDGTKGEYTVKSIDGKTLLTDLDNYQAGSGEAGDGTLDGKIAKYNINDDGTVSLTSYTPEIAPSFTVENGKAIVGSSYANDSTVYLYINPTTLVVSRFAGKNNVPTAGTPSNVQIASDPFNNAVLVVIPTDAPSTTATSSYAYVLDANYTESLEGYVYNVVINGEKTTLVASAAASATYAEPDTVYTIVKNAFGQAVLSTGNKAANVVYGDYVNYASTDVLVVRNGSNPATVAEYKITSSTTVYITEFYTGHVNGTLSINDKITYVLGPNNTVSAIFITDDN